MEDILNKREHESNSIKDYFNLIRNHLTMVSIITLSALIVSIIYAIKAPDIYKASTVLKVSKPQGSILNSPLIPDMQDFGSDRFIANEIEILKSYTIREKVANSLVEAFNNEKNKGRFNLILNKNFSLNNSKSSYPVKPKYELADFLAKAVSIDQKRGLDIVEISVESPSPYEAAVIANNYAQAYNELNLQSSRLQLTQVREFLAEQRKEKQKELLDSEEKLRLFQQAGGIVELDEQAKAMIKDMSDFDAQKNSAAIDVKVAEKNLAQYKSELKKQDPRLVDYVESFVTEPYLKSVQEQIAKLEIQKTIALADKESNSNKSLLTEYDNKIKSLKDKVEQKKVVYKSGILASNPEEVKLLTQKVIEEDVKYQASKASLQELNGIVSKYEGKFNKLPEATIEYARRERERAALEKLYLLVEQKYQEAQINEQSQPGNVIIVDNARIPERPSKPNRPLIILIGFVLGAGLGIGYAFIRNYLDNTVKVPEDIERRNINVLAWIPQMDVLTDGNKEYEFIVAKKPDSIPSEAFKALRTRVQFSRVEKDAIKTILITSSAPQEGKTTVSTNLAGSFAQAGKKTVIWDCDLRKPRLHNVFKANRFPGFTDYLFGQVAVEDIIRKSEVTNLDYITAGTIPPNPSEILGSPQFDDFLRMLKREYDIVIIDSPPVIAVTDAEILSRVADASMLVVSANTTEVGLMERSVELLVNDHSTFIGTILNNFSYKAGYGSYYKYYYYYSKPTNKGNIHQE